MAQRRAAVEILASTQARRPNGAHFLPGESVAAINDTPVTSVAEACDILQSAGSSERSPLPPATPQPIPRRHPRTTYAHSEQVGHLG
jgi:hypothetical protein